MVAFPSSLRFLVCLALVGVHLNQQTQLVLGAALPSPATIPSAASSVSNPASSASPPDVKAINDQDNKIRGVGLGGWLVPESFITPSLFSRTNNSAIVDEWSFWSLQPTAQATHLLQSHLDNFITERDFAAMAQLGLNHVRLPIPFYAIDVAADEPYLKLNRWELAKQAVKWAAMQRIRVIIDLHSLPGGQNGYDHSGRLGQNLWASNQTYFDRSLKIVETIATEFSKPEYLGAVIAIEPVNEPMTNNTRVDEYYKASHHLINTISSSTIVTLLDDGGPQNLDSWRNRAHPRAMTAMSSHPYLMFSDEDILLNRTDKVAKICDMGKQYQNFHQQEMYLVVDEMTPAFTDCAINVNGRGKGSRYDGTFPGAKGRRSTCKGKIGSGAGFSSGYKQMLALMWEAQVVSFERTAGWMQWTWKTEPGYAEDWSFSAGVAHGWIPQDLNERRFNVTCP
ncbi:hypothetical protein CF326_g6187 [Tilletia indica]|nr:hypothetical protein CF326_g6187 [Tilletia indica]